MLWSIVGRSLAWPNYAECYFDAFSCHVLLQAYIVNQISLEVTKALHDYENDISNGKFYKIA